MRFIVILVNKLPDIEKSLYQEVVDVINQIFEMLGTDVCIAALIATTYFAYGQPYVMKALTERCLRAAEETLREAEVNGDLQPVVSMLLNPVAHRYQLPKVSVPDARIAATILTTYYLYDQTLTVWTVANECLLTMDTIRCNEQDYERPICLVSRRLLSGLMRLLLDIDDDPAWRVENADDEVNGLSSNYKLGQHCLFLLAQNRERNTYFANSFSDICPIYLADPDWRKPHAALITLAQFAEGCGEEMVRILDPVNLGSNSFRILNVRVQWATLKLISQLLTKQHPDLRHQQQYYQRVRPVLIGAMNDASDTEIQANAVSLILDITKNCTQDILKLYLIDASYNLTNLCHDRNPMVQDDALTALVARSKKEALTMLEESNQPDMRFKRGHREAVTWYNRALGFRIECGHGIKFIFVSVDQVSPAREFSFSIRHCRRNDSYTLLNCDPSFEGSSELLDELNRTNDLFKFVRVMRKKFQRLSLKGLLWCWLYTDGADWRYTTSSSD